MAAHAASSARLATDVESPLRSRRPRGRDRAMRARGGARDRAKPVRPRISARLFATAGVRGAAIGAAKRACELAPDDPRALVGFRPRARAARRSRGCRTCFRGGRRDRRAFRATAGTTSAPRCASSAGRARVHSAEERAADRPDARRARISTLGNLLIERVSSRMRSSASSARRGTIRRWRARADAARGSAVAARGKLARAESLFRQSLGLDPEHVAGLARSRPRAGRSRRCRGCARLLSQRAGAPAGARAALGALPGAAARGGADEACSPRRTRRTR